MNFWHRLFLYNILAFFTTCILSSQSANSLFTKALRSKIPPFSVRRNQPAPATRPPKGDPINPLSHDSDSELDTGYQGEGPLTQEEEEDAIVVVEGFQTGKSLQQHHSNLYHPNKNYDDRDSSSSSSSSSSSFANTSTASTAPLPLSDPHTTTTALHQQQQQQEDEPLGIKLDRAAFRLDGLEVYAVVSALTLATSIQFFELLSQQWHWEGMAAIGLRNWETVLHLSSDLICLLASATGMITGLHATLIFSLMTVYGRTAMGMGWDLALSKFFQQTTPIRYRGFKSFRISLYTFCIQIGFIIVSRLPPLKWIRRLTGLILGIVMWKVYEDTQFIINKAGSVLFCTNTTQPTTSSMIEGGGATAAIDRQQQQQQQHDESNVNGQSNVDEDLRP